MDEINVMSLMDISSSFLDIFGEKLSIVLMTSLIVRGDTNNEEYLLF